VCVCVCERICAYAFMSVRHSVASAPRGHPLAFIQLVDESNGYGVRE
jgi:hypothetical protein